MLAFFNNYALILGIVAGILGVIAFVESRRHPVFRQPGTVSGVVLLALCLVAITAGLVTSLEASGNNRPIVNSSPSASTSLQSAGNTPISTQVPSTQPPTQPSSYRANWSQGKDGWGGTSDWSVYGGELHNSGLNNHSDDTPTIIVPFQPNSDDYAVEITFRTPSQYSGHCFGMTVRGSNSADGTMTGYSINFWCNSRGITSIRAFSGSSEGSTYDIQFNPSTAWHTSRIEVKLNTIKLFIDGGLLLNVTDNAYPTGRIIGLWSDQQPLDISSVNISSL